MYGGGPQGLRIHPLAPHLRAGSGAGPGRHRLPLPLDRHGGPGLVLGRHPHPLRTHRNQRRRPADSDLGPGHPLRLQSFHEHPGLLPGQGVRVVAPGPRSGRRLRAQPWPLFPDLRPGVSNPDPGARHHPHGQGIRPGSRSHSKHRQRAVAGSHRRSGPEAGGSDRPQSRWLHAPGGGLPGSCRQDGLPGAAPVRRLSRVGSGRMVRFPESGLPLAHRRRLRLSLHARVGRLPDLCASFPSTYAPGIRRGTGPGRELRHLRPHASSDRQREAAGRVDPGRREDRIGAAGGDPSFQSPLSGPLRGPDPERTRRLPGICSRRPSLLGADPPDRGLLQRLGGGASLFRRRHRGPLQSGLRLPGRKTPLR